MKCKKRAYIDRKVAKRDKIIVQRELKKKLYIYKCKSCLMYHLTSKRQTK